MIDIHEQTETYAKPSRCAMMCKYFVIDTLQILSCSCQTAVTKVVSIGMQWAQTVIPSHARQMHRHWGTCAGAWHVVFLELRWLGWLDCLDPSGGWASVFLGVQCPARKCWKSPALNGSHCLIAIYQGMSENDLPPKIVTLAVSPQDMISLGYSPIHSIRLRSTGWIIENYYHKIFRYIHDWYPHNTAQGSNDELQQRNQPIWGLPSFMKSANHMGPTELYED